MNIEYNDMAKKKSTKNWLHRHSSDRYVKLSQSGDYRSRAFHKLHEINEKYKILKSSKNILDLGSAPGSWSEYISRNFDNKNLVAIDLIEMKSIRNVYFINGDINKKADREKIINKMNRADLVLSDIAPNITGIEDVDQANFEEILESVLDICFDLLKINGVLVMKFFIGSSYDSSREKLKKSFDKVVVYKPESSRSSSNEIFFVCNGYKD
jgi:23S rRNA (uridine2552-2'-O)-methyltransferase